MTTTPASKGEDHPGQPSRSVRVQPANPTRPSRTTDGPNFPWARRERIGEHPRWAVPSRRRVGRGQPSSGRLHHSGRLYREPNRNAMVACHPHPILQGWMSAPGIAGPDPGHERSCVVQFECRPHESVSWCINSEVLKYTSHLSFGKQEVRFCLEEYRCGRARASELSRGDDNLE